MYARASPRFKQRVYTTNRSSVFFEAEAVSFQQLHNPKCPKYCAASAEKKKIERSLSHEEIILVVPLKPIEFYASLPLVLSILVQKLVSLLNLLHISKARNQRCTELKN